MLALTDEFTVEHLTGISSLSANERSFWS